MVILHISGDASLDTPEVLGWLICTGEVFFSHVWCLQLFESNIMCISNTQGL